MPTLHWLARDKHIRAASLVRYLLLEEARELFVSVAGVHAHRNLRQRAKSKYHSVNSVSPGHNLEVLVSFMSAHDIPSDLRTGEFFHHIDPGFLNRRLCMTALSSLRDQFIRRQKPGTDHMTVLANDHLLVTMLLDLCQAVGGPTLLEALKLRKPKCLFRSTERLTPCQEIYEAARVDHLVELDFDFGKPVHIAYHTRHLLGDTIRMTLAEGYAEGNVQSIVGMLHTKEFRYEIEPLVIGFPWLDHPRNGEAAGSLMWYGTEYGEILPEDIDEFSKMAHIAVEDAEEWMNVMQNLPEKKIKFAFAELLAETPKNDWGGESNDHFSSSVTVKGRRKTAAFLLKGPSKFKEMTLDMCGNRADQIHRLVDSDADISIVQHCHQIGEIVRRTLRNETVLPGGQGRKYCLIDGKATYRILKAYNLLRVN